MIDLAPGWTLWPDFVLRSAGFPVKWLDTLKSPRALRRVEELESLCDRSLEELERVLRVTDERAERKRLKRLRRRIARRGATALAGAVERFGSDTRLGSLAREAASLDQELAESFVAETEQMRQAMSQALSTSGILEAITWQNRRASHLLLDNLQHDKVRRHGQAMRTVTSYVQRYALKNDTAGFFGPFAWGRVTDAPTSIELSAGEALIDERRLYLEYWVIAALAERIDDEERMRPDLAPRLTPTFAIVDGTLTTPFGPMPLPEKREQLLASVDGASSARDLLAPLVADGVFASVEEGLTELESAANEGQVLWSTDVPNRDAPYGRHLEARLANAPEAKRREALKPLRRIQSLREEAEGAQGAEATAKALRALDEAVEAETNREAVRRGGEMYAGRTTCHLHCTRDVQLELGRPFVDKLAPLELLATSLRYLSCELAKAYGQALGEIYARLRKEMGTDDVPLARFYMEALPLFPTGTRDQPPELMMSVVDAFERRWWEILGLDESGEDAQFTHSELAPRVAEVFAAPGAGWPSARIHSPDVMLVASNVDAIRDGSFRVVLGEVHPFVCSVEQELFAGDHPDPERMRSTLSEWYPGGRVVFGVAPNVPGRHVLSPVTGFEHDVYLELPGTGRSPAPRERTVSLAQLIVRAHDGQLVIASRDGRFEWRGYDFLNNAFLPIINFAPSSWTRAPRVTIDEVILSRRKWRLPADDMAFAKAKNLLARWQGARRWARETGLPERVFFRSPNEVKPILLDLDSPALVDLFCSIVRKVKKGARLSFSELLPGPEESWLPDAEGDRYASELRLVLRDEGPVAPPPPLNL